VTTPIQRQPTEEWYVMRRFFDMSTSYEIAHLVGILQEGKAFAMSFVVCREVHAFDFAELSPASFHSVDASPWITIDMTHIPKESSKVLFSNESG
jgi:hypothetical protein